jgi:chromosome segregation ATPase
VTAIDTARSVVTHRGMSCLELHRLLGELQREVRYLTGRAEQATAMEARLDEQAKTICSLREQLDQAKAIRDDVHAKAGRVDEAEARATKAQQELAAQTEELHTLRAFRDNTNAVTAPAGIRDTSAIEDQATQPIRVLTLQQAHCIGPVLDPGRIS